jgi:hypothetical protein
MDISPAFGESPALVLLPIVLAGLFFHVAIRGARDDETRREFQRCAFIFGVCATPFAIAGLLGMGAEAWSIFARWLPHHVR